MCVLRARACVYVQIYAHRYIRLVEEQELYGEVLQAITDAELECECGVQDAGDRLALLDVFHNLVLHGPAHFDKETPERAPPPHVPTASPARPLSAAAAAAAAIGVDDRDRERQRRRERERQDAVTGRASEVGVWLDKIGMGKYAAAFEANGLVDLHSVAGLEPAQLKALGVKGRRENPYGPEETTSDLDLVHEALRGLRNALAAQAHGARPGGGSAPRQRGSFSARAAVEDNEEERLFQQALQESLLEYESSTSASGSAPSSRNTTSNPGTASSSTAPASQDPDASPTGSGGAGARRGGRSKDNHKGGKKQGGALVGLAKVRGLLDVCALSQPGKGAVRAYCLLKGNRLKLWWGSDVRDENLDPPNKEIVMDGKCVDAVQEGGRISSKCLFIRRSMFAVAHDDVHLTVVAESTFVEWLQRLQASAYLFSMGAPSLHSPVGAIVLRVLTITNASAVFQVACLTLPSPSSAHPPLLLSFYRAGRTRGRRPASTPASPAHLRHAVSALRVGAAACLLILHDAAPLAGCVAACAAASGPANCTARASLLLCQRVSCARPFCARQRSEGVRE